MRMSSSSAAPTNNSLYIANHTDFQFGTDEFTIEGFVNLDTPSSGALFSKEADLFTNGHIHFGISASKLIFEYRSQNGFRSISGTTVLAANTWYFISVTRSGGTITLAINGVADKTVTNSAYATDVIGGGTGTVYFGAYCGSSNLWGYVDEFRVVKGAAIHTTLAEAQAGLSMNLSAPAAVSGNIAVAIEVSAAITTAHGQGGAISAAVDVVCAMLGGIPVEGQFNVSVPVIAQVSASQPIKGEISCTIPIDSYSLGYIQYVPQSGVSGVVNASVEVTALIDGISAVVGGIAAQITVLAELSGNVPAVVAGKIASQVDIHCEAVANIGAAGSTKASVQVVANATGVAGVAGEASAAIAVRSLVDVRHGVAGEAGIVVKMGGAVEGVFRAPAIGLANVVIPLSAYFGGYCPRPLDLDDRVFVTTQPNKLFTATRENRREILA